METEPQFTEEELIRFKVIASQLGYRAPKERRKKTISAWAVVTADGRISEMFADEQAAKNESDGRLFFPVRLTGEIETEDE